MRKDIRYVICLDNGTYLDLYNRNLYAGEDAEVIKLLLQYPNKCGKNK